MSWMGGSGSFESRAKKAFANRGAQKTVSAADACQVPDHDPSLQGFSSRAMALFGSLESKTAASNRPVEAPPGAVVESPARWVVSIDSCAAEAAAELAAKAAADVAAETSISAANAIANSLMHQRDDNDGDEYEDERPPLHTAVMDGNAYDR
jgi:hypothetical protein